MLSFSHAGQNVYLLHCAWAVYFVVRKSLWSWNHGPKLDSYQDTLVDVLLEFAGAVSVRCYCDIFLHLWRALRHCWTLSCEYSSTGAEGRIYWSSWPFWRKQRWKMQMKARWWLKNVGVLSSFSAKYHVQHSDTTNETGHDTEADAAKVCRS